MPLQALDDVFSAAAPGCAVRLARNFGRPSQRLFAHIITLA